MAFESNTAWTNAQHVSSPTIMILTTTKGYLLWYEPVKLATVVKGNQNAPFSKATTPSTVFFLDPSVLEVTVIDV